MSVLILHLTVGHFSSGVQILRISTPVKAWCDASGLTMSDSARQQKVNFLMWDLVTGLLALILLLGLF